MWYPLPVNNTVGFALMALNLEIDFKTCLRSFLMSMSTNRKFGLSVQLRIGTYPTVQPVGLLEPGKCLWFIVHKYLTAFRGFSGNFPRKVQSLQSVLG